MYRRALFAAGLGLALFSSSGSAQGPLPAPTTYSFEPDDVIGAGDGPVIERLVVRRRGVTSSLIRVRAHFIPEMLKDVEDI